MKKQTQVLSMVAAGILLVGAIFKMQHFPGAAILILLGALVGFVYLIVFLVKGTAVLKRGTEKSSFIIGAIVMFIVLVGFLFKLNHWPGANILLWSSHLGLLVASILFIVDAYQESDNSKKSIKSLYSFMVFVFMIMLVFLAFIINNTN